MMKLKDSRGITMTHFSPTVTCWLLGASLLLPLAFAESTWAGGAQEPDKLWVYIGTYTQGTKSKGIYKGELDLASGKLTGVAVAGEAVNPSFVAIHPNHKF